MQILSSFFVQGKTEFSFTNWNSAFEEGIKWNLPPPQKIPWKLGMNKINSISSLPKTDQISTFWRVQDFCISENAQVREPSVSPLSNEIY